MVRELHTDAPTATATREEPAPDPGRDLSPDEVVMPSEPKRQKPKRPRNKRHGRAR